ncbi:MAG TPA: hypothetical protein VHX49_01090 [Candidatus Acidoferrales bacterium]|jgi:hypothetical protein|nr:hypothetical protein [Candidatus Acidoferrales bacterium]
MPATTMRILFAGTPAPVTDGVLARLAARGFGAHRADKLSDARDLLEIFRVDVVLASESLADGRGYALADAMKRQSGTLIVGVPLSESCLWLPVVERGLGVLGKRAFSPAVLEIELDHLLGIRLLEEKKARNMMPRLSDGQMDSDRTLRPVIRRNGN